VRLWAVAAVTWWGVGADSGSGQLTGVWLGSGPRRGSAAGVQIAQGLGYGLRVLHW
jgi:hypothetical protein